MGVHLQHRDTLVAYRYQKEWPYPVSSAFCRYSNSPVRNEAIRAKRLVMALESTLRYAGILAVCDYASLPRPDPGVLEWIRGRWYEIERFEVGHWTEAIYRLVPELAKHADNAFFGELAAVDTARLREAVTPLQACWTSLTQTNVHHVQLCRDVLTKHEDKLFAVLDQLDFIRAYPLCCMEEGQAHSIQICRGANRDFARLSLRESLEIDMASPFVWNRSFSAILLLAPLMLRGRANVSSSKPSSTGPAGRLQAALQGLMVLTRSEGRTCYTSLDESLHLPIDSFSSPRPADIRRLLGQAFKQRSTSPHRLDVALSRAERERFGVMPGDFPEGHVFETRTARYRVKGRPLGRGGMGVIYLVENVPARGGKQAALFALKALPLEMTKDGSLIRRFDREGRFLKTLAAEHNPNIVRVCDVGYQKPYHFIVMEYVQGESLASSLWQRRNAAAPYPYAEAVQIILQMCHGLRSVHGNNIVHRDLKPENVLIDKHVPENWPEDILVKLTDFGLSRRIDKQSIALSLSGGLGSLEYMAPEQRMGGRVDQRTDIYAIGKVLAEMLTGTVPKNAEEVGRMDFAAAFVELGKGGPSDERSEVRIAGIKGVIQRCLATPEDRFATVDELAEALESKSELDVASSIALSLGIESPAVSTAFSLAGIGQGRARSQLLRWCLTPDHPLHREAVVAFINLEPGASDELAESLREYHDQVKTRRQNRQKIPERLRELRSELDVEARALALAEREGNGTGIAECRQKCGELRADIEAAEEENEKSRDKEKEYRKRASGLTSALAIALDWLETYRPALWGQRWLRGLPLRKQIIAQYLSRTRRRIFGGIAETFAWYAGMSSCFGAVTSLFTSTFQGTVMWRANTAGTNNYATFFMGHMAMGLILYGPVAAATLAAKVFERPRRYLATIGYGSAATVLSSTFIWRWAHTQIREQSFIDAFLTRNRALEFFTGHLGLLALLVTTGLMIHFVVRELPLISRRLPSRLYSMVAMPILVTALAAITIPTFYAPNAFKMRELFGQIIIVFGASVGAGVAEFILDRRRQQ